MFGPAGPWASDKFRFPENCFDKNLSLECAGLAALWPNVGIETRQVADSTIGQNGAGPPHSKELILFMHHGWMLRRLDLGRQPGSGLWPSTLLGTHG